MLPLRARLDLRVMAMKGYCIFPKALALLEPHHRLFSVISRTPVGGVLLLSREAVGVFYSPNRQGDLGRELHHQIYMSVVARTQDFMWFFKRNLLKLILSEIEDTQRKMKAFSQDSIEFWLVSYEIYTDRISANLRASTSADFQNLRKKEIVQC